MVNGFDRSEFMAFNLSATLNAFRALKNPAILCPHYTISTFSELPVPLSSAIPGSDIRAVVLDKDNCFAVPYSLDVFPPYSSKILQLRAAYPGDKLIVVSNSSGTHDDAGAKEADELEKRLSIRVLRHSTKKPGCWPQVLRHLKEHAGVERADQVAVVGDRLLTDVMMANMMGAWAVWVRNGVEPAEMRFTGRIEHGIADILKKRGWRPPTP